MVFISEWLPNPIGADAQGEWIELQNNGSVPIDLSAWKIQADAGKAFALRGVSVPANGFTVLPRSVTRMTLRNTDGRLMLFDGSGAVAQRIGFLGAAPEGKSANRAEIGAFFASPTPGAMNVAPQTALVLTTLPFGARHPTVHPAPSGVLTGFVVACVSAFLVVVLIRRNHDLRELFFGAY